MAEQYLHKYLVEFGQPISFYSGTGEQSLQDTPIPLQPNSTTNPSQVNSYLDNSETETAISLSEHNISFEINKTKESDKPSTITFYNISNNTAKFLEQYQGNNPAILIRAGYFSDEEIPIIFQGEVISYKEEWQGPTRITTCQLKSGAKNLKEAYTVKSYRAGTSITQIIEDTIKDLKLPKGTIYYPRGNDVTVQTVIRKPVIINSPTSEFLKKFSKENGYKFWIEDGTVNVYPDNYVLRAGEFVFDISSDTNMIGSPVASETEANAQERQPRNKVAITVTTTLNGAYTVGSKVRVTSRLFYGVYEITGITHRGTYEGSDWSSSLELKPVDGWEEA